MRENLFRPSRKLLYRSRRLPGSRPLPHATSTTLSGLRMLSGSSASLIARITPTASAPCCLASHAFLPTPMPCSRWMGGAVGLEDRASYSLFAIHFYSTLTSR